MLATPCEQSPRSPSRRLALKKSNVKCSLRRLSKASSRSIQRTTRYSNLTGLCTRWSTKPTWQTSLSTLCRRRCKRWSSRSERTSASRRPHLLAMSPRSGARRDQQRLSGVPQRTLTPWRRSDSTPSSGTRTKSELGDVSEKCPQDYRIVHVTFWLLVKCKSLFFCTLRVHGVRGVDFSRLVVCPRESVPHQKSVLHQQSLLNRSLSEREREKVCVCAHHLPVDEGALGTQTRSRQCRSLQSEHHHESITQTESSPAARAVAHQRRWEKWLWDDVWRVLGKIQFTRPWSRLDPSGDGHQWYQRHAEGPDWASSTSYSLHSKRATELAGTVQLLVIYAALTALLSGGGGGGDPLYRYTHKHTTRWSWIGRERGATSSVAAITAQVLWRCASRALFRCSLPAAPQSPGARTGPGCCPCPLACPLTPWRPAAASALVSTIWCGQCGGVIIGDCVQCR